MIQLYQFPPMFGLPNISPFCLKTETWLLMSGLAYESVYTGDTSLAPNQKLPFIVDGETPVADSRLIPAYLKAKTAVDPDAHLTPQQRAVAHAFGRMVDEQLLWALIYTRFSFPDIRETMKNSLLGGVPEAQRDATFQPMVERVTQMLDMQGIGRLSETEVLQLATEDLAAITQQLGQQPFITGAEPCSADTALFGFLANFIWGPLGGPIGEQARRHPTLINYCERILARYYPDYAVPT